MKKINKNKVYTFIGKTVVYSTLYFGGIAFTLWSLTRITVY